MEERPEYPESLSEAMEDADNREPSVMDTLYGLPFPSEDEYENTAILYASPSPGLLGIIRKLFGR